MSSAASPASLTAVAAPPAAGGAASPASHAPTIDEQFRSLICVIYFLLATMKNNVDYLKCNELIYSFNQTFNVASGDLMKKTRSCIIEGYNFMPFIKELNDFGDKFIRTPNPPYLVHSDETKERIQNFDNGDKEKCSYGMLCIVHKTKGVKCPKSHAYHEMIVMVTSNFVDKVTDMHSEYKKSVKEPNVSKESKNDDPFSALELTRNVHRSVSRGRSYQNDRDGQGNRGGYGGQGNRGGYGGYGGQGNHGGQTRQGRSQVR